LLSGIAELSEFYREHEREELIDQSGEIQSLRAWLEEIRTQTAARTRSSVCGSRWPRPSESRTTSKAAEVRDQLRKLQASET
jgi:lipopolysaccharide biosynthesis protein